jgi:hypothetical protein
MTEPAAHMLPSDLSRFATSETTGMAFSVAVGTPDERSVPLYLAPRVPDFAALKDKRMSELTPEQQDDALELWAREQIVWFGPESRKVVELLLRRLDEARGVRP